MAAPVSANRGHSVLLWLFPIISIGDVLWAISAKAGLVITFGLGLYRWEMIHVIVQVSLIVALSLYFVVSSPAGEEPVVVEEADAAVREERQGD